MTTSIYTNDSSLNSTTYREKRQFEDQEQLQPSIRLKTSTVDDQYRNLEERLILNYFFQLLDHNKHEITLIGRATRVLPNQLKLKIEKLLSLILLRPKNSYRTNLDQFVIELKIVIKRIQKRKTYFSGVRVDIPGLLKT